MRCEATRKTEGRRLLWMSRCCLLMVTVHPTSLTSFRSQPLIQVSTDRATPLHSNLLRPRIELRTHARTPPPPRLQCLSQIMLLLIKNKTEVCHCNDFVPWAEMLPEVTQKDLNGEAWGAFQALPEGSLERTRREEEKTYITGT